MRSFLIGALPTTKSVLLIHKGILPKRGGAVGNAPAYSNAMIASTATFSGKGPFYLLKIEHARADALDNTIQLTLFAQVEGRGQELVQIETQMALRAAELLANTLDHAINDVAREGPQLQ